MANREFQILVCAGHNRRIKGAKNNDLQLHEWSVNRIVTEFLVLELLEHGYDVQEVKDSTLPMKIKICSAFNPDLAFDIHMNSFNRLLTGHLCMYWHNSLIGRIYAECISKAMVHNHERDCIAVKSKEERGSYFLRKTKCPAVIIEVGFIDNTYDIYSTFKSVDNVAKSIRSGIEVAIHHLVADKTLKEAIAIQKGFNYELQKAT